MRKSRLSRYFRSLALCSKVGRIYLISQQEDGAEYRS